ncbi:phosphate transport system substrate-binding protein [Dehalogenimonas formicexedens]|uniref:Phosphate-binding protein n=1 Tax=Dehalogenimonas formicexedens TaxID=1839801 RepID=A0A1P8F8Z1_9CHLR|nr:phosphate ABC transporter substrate-binding protein PstS [Dehalogenimonas formicexedens]APV44939.1 phosphate transport system substrate-binding protein [Dehalogenimonas formicexedens]
MKIRRFLKWFALPTILVVSLLGGMIGCGDNSNTTTPPGSTTTNPPGSNSALAPFPATPVALNGAGATFPAVLYQKWFDVFNQQYKVPINYQAVGSGSGISAITGLTVDFGASDGIMTDAQVAAATAAGGPILHIPMTSGAVVLTYNLPGIKSGDLKLSGDVLANIFLTNIKKWNDPAIVALNPTLTLPNADITVVHRSDGSGTTNIFTNYLSKVSSEWSTRVGSANSVNWPGGVGGSGNAGVAGQVQQIPNSIGYVELIYALQNNMAFAQLKNKSGNFITPSLESTTAAAQGITLPDDMKIMITDSANANAYPIAGFTWILVYQNQTNKDKGTELVNFLWWALHDGTSYEAGLQFAAIPADAVKKAEVLIKSIKYQGQPILP